MLILNEIVKKKIPFVGDAIKPERESLNFEFKFELFENNQLKFDNLNLVELIVQTIESIEDVVLILPLIHFYGDSQARKANRF